MGDAALEGPRHVYAGYDFDYPQAEHGQLCATTAAKVASLLQPSAGGNRPVDALARGREGQGERSVASRDSDDSVSLVAQVRRIHMRGNN